MSRIKFGTDGWRAVVGQDFNLKNVAAVAQAISDYLNRTKPQAARGKKEVVVGYDTRRLSKQSAQLISQVLAANNLKVILSERPLPTPAVSFAVRRRKCAAGVMVTASHNPPRFNGIKIKDAQGSSVESVVTDQVEELVFKNQPRKLSRQQAKKKRLLKITDLVTGYLQFLVAYLHLPTLNKGRLRVLVDSMHGSADSYIARILKSSHCQVKTIHRSFDPSFGGVKPEPIQPCLTEAAATIRKEGFALGLATDGDADRIAALDAKGRFINPQQIISLLALYLIRCRKLTGGLVKTISGTSLIDKIAQKYHLRVYNTPVGFKHISDLMQKKDILIGGEEGGGIGFKNYLPERDGILGGLLLLEMLIAENKSLEDLLKDTAAEFGSFVYLRKDLHSRQQDKSKIRAKLQALRRRKTFFNLKIAKIEDYDGLKFCLVEGSWILFRLSGTEPILRIYAESSSLTKTKALISEGTKWIRN
ncbi:phosphoglucomutase/phosphomannomutase family protein [Candidatus Omnitrophota bacterium]